jgi:hypothetical protein
MASVSIDFWSLIGAIAAIVVSFATLIWAFSKMFIRQLDRRFTESDAKTSDLIRQINEVDREVLKLRAELPNNYVQREDWIRFCATIDTKLDWLREKGEDTKQLVTQLVTKGNLHSGAGSKNDAR